MSPSGESTSNEQFNTRDPVAAGGLSSGERFDAAPNVDHAQAFVKRDLCQWLAWLREHAGFDGFRLDFVKGFAGRHVADYIAAAQPAFVVCPPANLLV